MNMNEYQLLAKRTIPEGWHETSMIAHALHGISSEIGELHGIYQKSMFQGHDFSEEHAQKEVGDILWFIAEYCTGMGWNLDDIARLNIEKLKARYPEGFSEENSLHRKEGDI